MLAEKLEQADPTIYEIVQNVRLTLCDFAGNAILNKSAGEKPTKALHQPHSLGELHLPGRS